LEIAKRLELLKINEAFDFEGLTIIKNEVELQLQPFGTEMPYDFVCRREGDEWPILDEE
jgi:hypothetical protein